MLSPWFMRRRLGLAITLPAVGLLGVVAPVSAVEARQAADKAVTGRPVERSLQRSGFIESLTKPAIAEVRAAAAKQLRDIEPMLAQADPASDAPRPRQLMDLVSEATDAPTPEEIVSEAVASDEASADESATDEADEATEAAPPVLSAPSESTSNADNADVPIPDERVLDDLQFLDPAPNPLLIQTQPEEVEIIGTQPLNLEEALALSYRNNPDLQVVLLELERSEAALREAQAANFPTLSINGTVQGQNTTSSGDTQLVPTPDGGFTFESETAEEVGFFYSTQAELVYNLFSSGRRSASISAAAEQVQLALLEVERRREELRLATANEFYDLQAAIESIRISQAFLNEAERNLQDTTLREQVGVGTRFDVLRAEVQVANARQDVVNAERSRQVAQRSLARRLNVPPSLTITTVPVDIAGNWPLSLEESIVLAYQNRAELEQQLTQRDVNELLQRVELAALGPQVNLFANYSISDFFNQEDRFSDNYALGARVSWTIFEGGAAQARARQRELDAEIAERNFEETRNTVRLGVESAYYNLQANQTNIGTARLAVTQAQEALDLAILRFDAGVGTQLDILNAQSELTNAEVNLVQAIVGYNRSLAELERAVSNLPESYYEALPY
ncbi:TolC family protein [Halomicronema sp. CCY15110]|uniref:TolC family protein n=1 Tax=Halomicronema sp. CCY15110 TaxID=2767773 RepID=UPI001EF28592|nr:TolC family protein [Halomicronema sp. CCY15110]